MKRKYFFFDIDGTLTVKKTGQAVESALLAIRKLQEAGHFTALATGRAHYKARPFMELAGMHDMVCAGGGALVYQDQLLCNKPLDRDKAVRIAREALDAGYGVLFQLEDSVKVWTKDKTFENQCGPRKEPTEYIYDPNLEPEQLDQILKLYISIPEEEENQISSLSLLSSLRFVKNYLMFQYDEKHQGILELLEKAGGTKEDVVVFGDDVNDLVMFDPDWFSIAMGNAGPEVKEKADYVTDASGDDGIWNACEKFGWFEKVNE